MKRIHKDIDGAIQQFNFARRLNYPAIGHLRFADIHGDGGPYRPRVYAIINANGGVSYSELNGASYPETLAKIKSATEGV
jgi:hypothetical protein